MNMNRIYYLILLLFAGPIVYAGGKDTFAYHTIVYLENNTETDTSSVSDYRDFFEKRMNGDSKKNGPYKILFETEYFVYYGRIGINRFKQPIVYEYYRTDKHILQDKFPRYQGEVWIDLWGKGDCIGRTMKLYDSLKKAGYINTPELLWRGTHYRLTDYIEAEDTYHVKHWFKKNILSTITCTTYFDKETLAVVRTSISEQEYDRKSKNK